MEGAFFISRTDLVNWINDVLHLQYKKLEEAANGAAFCQVLDVIYPNKVPMSRVNFNAKLGYLLIFFCYICRV
jgi:RP/EB family microtubule-associated protein